ncbi:hypothetical protein [Candidatus Thiothrix anitrata]|uniref:Uncharacterized protein n=1 Tax=Candidatus Thiothrix anitrata TaxID=2823902 RepID=A0ABX7X8N2_9GAMM|nr:hypothetical protein [Candidatus Thiothrix anitrata]QTR51588.1 hypothetical protein J8380_08625 [Candidatus Thiothrix anitrata]
MKISKAKRVTRKNQVRVLAYFFRHIGEDGPTGWVGIVAAMTPHELLWALDEHGDPHSMLLLPLARLHNSIVAWKEHDSGLSENYQTTEIDMYEAIGAAAAQSFPLPREDGWATFHEIFGDVNIV